MKTRFSQQNTMGPLGGRDNKQETIPCNNVRALLVASYRTPFAFAASVKQAIRTPLRRLFPVVGTGKWVGGQARGI